MAKKKSTPVAVKEAAPRAMQPLFYAIMKTKYDNNSFKRTIEEARLDAGQKLLSAQGSSYDYDYGKKRQCYVFKLVEVAEIESAPVKITSIGTEVVKNQEVTNNG